MVNEPDSEQDRPRGILSPTDRRYMRDPEQYVSDRTRAAESTRRGDIRERLQHGLRDFTLLFEQLDEEQRDAIVMTVNGDVRADLRESIDATLALLYELCWVADWDFRERLQRAADEVYSVHSPRPDPEPKLVGEVTFDIPRRPLHADRRVYEKGRRKLEAFLGGEADDQLTDREVRVLFERADDDVAAMLDEYRDHKQTQLRPEKREAARGLVSADVDVGGAGGSG